MEVMKAKLDDEVLGWRAERLATNRIDLPHADPRYDEDGRRAVAHDVLMKPRMRTPLLPFLHFDNEGRAEEATCVRNAETDFSSGHLRYQDKAPRLA